VAFQYLRGSGIEIGPLHQPLEVSSQANVRYVDRMPVEELKKQYPELSVYLVEPDILDDGETSSISDDSVDFVIVITWLSTVKIRCGENFLRVLKPWSFVYGCTWQKCTFDLERPVTSLDIWDYKEGRGQCTLTLKNMLVVDKVSEDNFAAHLKHCWH